MENMIDSVMSEIRGSIIAQYDRLCAVQTDMQKELSNEEVDRRMDLAICIVCAAMLNRSTLEQIYILRKSGYLLF
jgi:hypothetical protein